MLIIILDGAIFGPAMLVVIHSALYVQIGRHLVQVFGRVPVEVHSLASSCSRMNSGRRSEPFIGSVL